MYTSKYKRMDTHVNRAMQTVLPLKKKEEAYQRSTYAFEWSSRWMLELARC